MSLNKIGELDTRVLKVMAKISLGFFPYHVMKIVEVNFAALAYQNYTDVFDGFAKKAFS